MGLVYASWQPIYKNWWYNRTEARRGTGMYSVKPHIDNLAQDCSISSALAVEILQSCIKPSIHKCLISLPCWSSRQSIKLSWHGDAFRITGPLWGQFTGSPLRRASNAELWYFVVSLNRLSCWTNTRFAVGWDAMLLMWLSCKNARLTSIKCQNVQAVRVEYWMITVWCPLQWLNCV